MKKTLMILATAFLATALCACGGRGEKKTTVDSEEAEVQTEEVADNSKLVYAGRNIKSLPAGEIDFAALKSEMDEKYGAKGYDIGLFTELRPEGSATRMRYTLSNGTKKYWDFKGEEAEEIKAAGFEQGDCLIVVFGADPGLYVKKVERISPPAK